MRPLPEEFACTVRAPQPCHRINIFHRSPNGWDCLPVHFPGIPRAQGRPSRACPGIPRDNIRNGNRTRSCVLLKSGRGTLPENQRKKRGTKRGFSRGSFISETSTTVNREVPAGLCAKKKNQLLETSARFEGLLFRSVFFVLLGHSFLGWEALRLPRVTVP